MSNFVNGREMVSDILIKETAAALAARAGFGRLWVKDNTPNKPYFSNDAGTDTELATFDSDASEMAIVSSQTVTVENASIPNAVKALITGLQDNWAFTAGSTGAITVYADYSGTVAGTVKATDVGHGLTTGDYITIRGTTSYNGVFQITVVDADNFYFTDTWVADDGASDWEMGSYLTPDSGAEGDYIVIWSGSFNEAGGAGSVVYFKVYQNTTELTKATRDRKFANNDVGMGGGNALMAISASDRIWFAIQSGGTNDIVISYLDIVVHRLG